MPISGKWKKSSRSGGNGSCVEVRLTEGSVQVRDTKLGDQSPILGVPAGARARFAGRVARGGYDLG